MANPAADFRAQVQANHPGATVAERGRNFIRHQHPSDPAKFILDTAIGPIHYGVSEDQEIDTAWQATTGAWDWEMTTNDWQTFARDTFNVGDIFQFEKDGESVAFDPQSINWIDENTSRQQIAIKQAVVGTVTDDRLTFTDGYKSGIHFEYHNQTGRLKKIITIDNFAAIDTTLPDGNTIWFEAEFTISHSSGVEVYLDGVQWAKANNVRVQTADRIEFRDAATGSQVFWWLDFPRAWDSDENETIGEMEVRRDGAPTNLFITVRIPKTWIDTATFPIYIDPTIDPQVAASDDDARENVDNTGFNRNGNQVWIQSNDDDVEYNRTIGGFRFQCTGPASGDTIDVSYITVVANTPSVDDANMDIYCEDVDSADDFGTTLDVASRTKTAGSAGWVADGLGTSAVNSPSIVTPVEDVITDRAGWSSGNFLVVLMQGRADFDRQLRVQAYDFSTTDAAILHIEYTAAGGGPQSITLNELTLASSPETIIVSPGNVNIGLNELTLSSSPEALTIASIVSISLNELNLLGSAEALTVSPGQIATILNSLNLVSSVEAIQISPGAISIVTNELTLTASVESVSIVPGGISLSINELTLTSSLESLQVSPGVADILLSELTLVSSAEPLTIQVLAGVNLNTLTLSSSPETLTVSPGAVSTLLDTLILSSSPESISIAIGANVVSLNELTLNSSIESLNIVPGAISVTLGELTLSSSLESLVVSPGSISIALDELILNASLESVTLVPGNVSLGVDTLILSSSIESITIFIPGIGQTITLDTLTLQSQALSLNIRIPITTPNERILFKVLESREFIVGFDDRVYYVPLDEREYDQ